MKNGGLKMKAMLIKQYGGTENFILSDIKKPEIKPKHLLIKIKASSVNTVDTMIRQMGKDLPLSPDTPAILGMDFAGIIEEVGEGITKFSIGDEVFGCAGGLIGLQGTLAEYILADEKLCALKPQKLSMKEAAAIPLVGITAYEGITRLGNIRKKNTLIHGGAGGVGHIAIQLANYFGANVFSTGGNGQQLSLIEELGATPINYVNEKVEDYVSKHTKGIGFDTIFDTVGGENLLKSFDAAALNAQISTTVSLLDLNLTTAHFKGLSLHVVFMLIPMLHNHKREVHGQILTKLAEIIDEGNVKPILDDTDFSLEQIGLAHERLASKKALGKIVVSL